MTSTLTAAGLTALLAEPDLFELLHRPTKRHHWKRVAVGTHAECVRRLNGCGEWWLRTATNAGEGLGLFAEEIAVNERPEAVNANAS